jgi:hypothetical protein
LLTCLLKNIAKAQKEVDRLDTEALETANATTNGSRNGKEVTKKVPQSAEAKQELDGMTDVSEEMKKASIEDNVE